MDTVCGSWTTSPSDTSRRIFRQSITNWIRLALLDSLSWWWSKLSTLQPGCQSCSPKWWTSRIKTSSMLSTWHWSKLQKTSCHQKMSKYSTSRFAISSSRRLWRKRKITNYNSSALTRPSVSCAMIKTWRTRVNGLRQARFQLWVKISMFSWHLTRSIKFWNGFMLPLVSIMTKRRI